jgi:hypothetical protein
MARIIVVVIMGLFTAPASAAKIVLVAGGGTVTTNGTPAAKAKLVTPFGLDFNSQGVLYFVEMEKGERLRFVSLDGNLWTGAGTGAKGNDGDGGSPLLATFNGMHGLAIDRHDTIFLADTWNNRVRAVYDKQIEAFAGSGRKGKRPADGDARHADLGGIFAIASDAPREKLIITDLDNRVIYEVNPGARAVTLTRIAGNGSKGTPKDGATATEQPLTDPRAAIKDAAGNLYILERNAHCLRVVNPDGVIKTVLGTGKAGTAVGPALESQMSGPKHLCCDKDGSVYIADAENHRILKFDPKTNLVSVVAGTGKKGHAGLNGDPLKCELNRPHGVCVHPKTGELYIVDSYNDRILKIVP